MTGPKRPSFLLLLTLALVATTPALAQEAAGDDLGVEPTPSEAAQEAPQNQASHTGDAADRSPDLPNVSDLFEAHRHKVISVQTELAPIMGANNPFFGAPNSDPPRGEGTGFIVAADGFAITNWHVVADAHSIEVTTADGQRYAARLVGADPSTDIALIAIADAPAIEAVELGSAQEATVGDWVIAVGSPFGLEQSVTVGVLSAKGRQIGVGPYDDFLQTDASINPGNSGGPLFNRHGQVIGVNTAIMRNGRGIGFAVPIDTVSAILPDLRDTGYVVRGFLGAGLQEMSRDLAETFGIAPNDGVLIRSLAPDGPAQRAGLAPGDVVTHLADSRTRQPSELMAAVAALEPDQSVELQLLRDGRSQTVTVTVGERPDPQRERVLETRQARPQSSPDRLGVALTRVNSQMRRRHQLAGDADGVYVERVEAGSAASGVLRRGDIIVQIGDHLIDAPDDVPTALNAQPDDEPIRLRIYREGEPHFVAVRLGPSP